MSTFWKDWLERVAWTAAQAVVGVAIINVSDLADSNQVWWAALIIPGLSALKGFLGKQIGDRGTASVGGDAPQHRKAA